jgi:heme oxygenase
MNRPVRTSLSVRDHLRRATAGIHEALHRATPFAAIADGAATRESYGRTLVFLHRYHSAMAPLSCQGAQALDAPLLGEIHGTRITALENDLAWLGVAPDRTQENAVDQPAAFAIGALYTVQGSTLGGKLIHRQLDTLLPDDNGRTFFRGTEEDSRHWRLLCERLETCAAPLDALAAGAHHAFAKFQSMLG